MSFQSDYEHWANNRHHYRGIHPIHRDEKWEVSVIANKIKLDVEMETLGEAKQAVSLFRKMVRKVRQSAGEGVR